MRECECLGASRALKPAGSSDGTLQENFRKSLQQLIVHAIRSLQAVSSRDREVPRPGFVRRNGTDQLDFLLYDGDFFVPIIRLDLLERDNLPLPNTWDEALAFAESFSAKLSLN